MKKNNSFMLVLIFLFVGGLAKMYFNSQESSNSARQQVGVSAVTTSVDTTNSGVKDVSVSSTSKKITPDLQVQKTMQEYFSQLKEKNPGVRAQFELIKSKLPPSATSELIAMYGATVLGRSGQEDFLNYNSELISSVQQNSEAIATILESHSEQLRENAFQHQVLLNLASSLKIPMAQKAAIMGPSLVRTFEVDSKGHISEESASLAIALIQMKKANIDIRDIQDFIRAGVEKNAGNPRALNEYLARIKTYYDFNE